MKKINNNYLKIIFYLFLIYLLIAIQYPLGSAILDQFFNQPLPNNLSYNITPNHLLLWGGVRVFAILPLIFTVLTLKEERFPFYLKLGDKKRIFTFTFWGIFAFTLLGIFLYPGFLSQSKLTLGGFFLLSPYFALYAISNAFVEEIFFRGELLNHLNEKVNFTLSNIIQAIFFATIHLTGSVLTNKFLLFVILTFFLGLFWGWLTKKTKSLLPAIIFHIVADIFVAISLF